MADLPDNFVPLLGRAEDVAPFAAHGPFAESAVMIAPPASSLNSMTLAAILAVKPKGFINLYMDASIENDLSWIAKAGFDVLDEIIEAGDPLLPESESLKRYESVRHIRVSSGDLDPDGTDGLRWLVSRHEGEGGSFGGCAEVSDIGAALYGSGATSGMSSLSSLQQPYFPLPILFSGMLFAGAA
jgi:hypothetical protein